jgi:cobalt-zinc-cadmium efflux system protein
MVAEIVGGVAARSLALLADAGHMLTDAAALAFALVAARMAVRPARGRWTYGYSRLEILAAQANGITLGLVALWVVWSAVHRLIDPQDVRGGLVVVVALAGYAVVGGAAWVAVRRARSAAGLSRRDGQARDIHDDVVQGLTQVNWALEAGAYDVARAAARAAAPESHSA